MRKKIAESKPGCPKKARLRENSAKSHLRRNLCSAKPWKNLMMYKFQNNHGCGFFYFTPF